MSSTPTVADLVAVKPLEWKPAGYDGQWLEASALGLEVCFRVHGKPGDWTLTSPGAREYVHTPGYETRADATAAAQTDFERRILAALSPAATEPVAWQSIDTAPAGCITEDVGCRGASEWFLGRVSRKYRAGRPPFMVIRRRAWPQGDNWECAGEAYYVPDFFDAWAPLYAAPPSPVTVEEAAKALLSWWNKETGGVSDARKVVSVINGLSSSYDGFERFDAALRALAGEKRDD